MGDNTKIEWPAATWNPVRGCSRVSRGCMNCYAERVAHRFSGPGQPYEGLIASGGQWNGRIRLVPERLHDPWRWQRSRRVFVNSMSDLFHPEIPVHYIDQVFAVMAAAPQHQFQILTKRPAVMREYFDLVTTDDGPTRNRVGALALEMTGRRNCDSAPSAWAALYGWPLPNVWLGVSVEDQETADERIPQLLATPAAVHWISAEPLLGPVRLRYPDFSDAGHGRGWIGKDDGSAGHGPTLDWVVVGGESGSGSRPMDPAWARSLRDQCQLAGVPFLFKQWGEYVEEQDAYNLVGEDTPWLRQIDRRRVVNNTIMLRVGKRNSGRLLDGVLWNEIPLA